MRSIGTYFREPLLSSRLLLPIILYSGPAVKILRFIPLILEQRDEASPMQLLSRECMMALHRHKTTLDPLLREYDAQ